MRLILHIGTEKTGTTSLQRSLSSHRSGLADQGIGYFDSLGTENHRKLPIYGQDFNPQDDGFQAFGISTKRQQKGFRTNLVKEIAAELT